MLMNLKSLAMLTPEENKLYIEIKTAEIDEDYNTMQYELSQVLDV